MGASRERSAKPSERSFGFVMTAFFTVVAMLPLVHRAPPRIWALGVASAFALAALGAPRLLSPLNRAWLALGEALHRVTTPIALALLFYGVIVPTAVAMRLAGKDPLRLRRDPGARSYWIAREPPGPPPDSLRNQF